ncbi:MAG: hypothetical protein SFU85_04000 [Candidatus Methylacidiphilales bacterium]|nr:hypothetical protein [Candidatus Methylacidiphilales bacterium]
MMNEPRLSPPWRMLWGCLALTLTLTLSPAVVPDARSASFSLPSTTRQLITARASTWDDSSATLQCWEKSPQGWKSVGQPVPVRLGKSGLAWGRGLHPEGLPGPLKKENDGRAPAGVFALGGAYGYAAEIQRRPALSYQVVTASDLWVEDTASPDYNRHLRLPGGRGPANDWEKQQQMKQDDPAHSLKLFIAHNAGNQTLAGAGSAIFFHIWRDGGAKASTGCTVMAGDRLREIIAWVDPAAAPLYVLLPEAVYQERKTAWQLP